MIRDKLVIFLPPDNLSRPDWAIIDAASIVTHPTRQGDPAELTRLARDKEIIVIVPAEDVLLTTVKLPKMSRSRLAQALPFAMEDQLVSDIDTLHFAWGEVQADDNMPVAVIARTKMQAWLALLPTWHIQPDVVLPAVLALPFSTEVWHVMVHDLAYVRTGTLHGFACDRNNLSNFMEIAMASAPTRPRQIVLHNYSDQSALNVLAETQNLQEQMLPPTKMITDFARLTMHMPNINLLHGLYAAKKSRFPRMQKMLQAAMGLAIAWVLLLFLYPTISYFMLNHRVSNIDAQIEQIYRHHFPQSTSVVAPKLRMEEKLHKLAAQIGENRFLLLLGNVGKGILQTSSGITLKRLDFQNNQMTLELTAQSSEDFSAFTDFLSQNSLSVKQQNANLAGTRVNASVVVE